MTRAISSHTLEWFKTSVVKDESLLGQVRRHILMTAGDDDLDRDVDHLHPSEVCKGDWCPRNSYYRMVHTPVTDKPRNPSWLMETMWTRGKEIHERWQNTFWSMGILEGWWYCRACQHQWPAVSPQICPRCFMPRWAIAYNEVPIYDDEMMLIGHADGKIVGDGLIEVKSIGVGTYRFDAPPLYELYQNGMTLEKIWKKIQRPFPVHVRQGMLYLHATGLPEITFIYEAKHNQDAKQFVVRYNKNFITPVVDQCILVAKSVRGERPPPPRPEWAEEPDSKICKSCEYRSTCWKLEESHGNEAGEAESVPVRVKRSVGRSSRRKATQPAS